jgi:hypothetical protein
MSTSLLKQNVEPVPATRKPSPIPRQSRRHAPDASLHFATQNESRELPPTAQLLTGGGDARIVCGPEGANRYGCSAIPDPEVLAFGSSTASTISVAGFAAADALRERLNLAAPFRKPAIAYGRELDRVRGELTTLCGLEALPGLEIIFGASGTDLHLFASQLMSVESMPAPLIVRVESAETGRGVPDALAGRHFSDCAALGDAVIAHVPLDCGRPIDIREVKCRTTEGTLRPVETVDREVEGATVNAVASGKRVLITLVDVSKTGFLAPSPACAIALKKRFPESIEVLVDACQCRLAPSTLRAYLEHDFIVAITGSKFITGPTFCGALLVPAGAARRLRTRTLPAALKSYSARADWPRNWAARDSLRHVPNDGLLLRWEAALTEMRAFRQLCDSAITNFLESFAKAITGRLERDPLFEGLPTPALDRGPIASAKSWDRLPTIFSFLLRRPASSGKPAWLNQSETKKVHELLRENLCGKPGYTRNPLLALRCQLGQPVECGTRDGIPVSALRLCLSSRLIVDAILPTGRGREAVLSEALTALDKTSLLASLLIPA